MSPKSGPRGPARGGPWAQEAHPHFGRPGSGASLFKSPMSRPGAFCERPWRPPGTNLAPESLGGLHEAILEPSELNFKASGGRF